MIEFERGQTVLIQEVWRGKVWSARPMIVVEDREDFSALWFPQGTIWQAPTTPERVARAGTRGERLAECLLRARWGYREMEWDVSSLWLAWPGAPYSIWPSWTDGFTPLGWYVNLQEPFVRTERGFHWMDQTLDIIVRPDRSSWYWKDEDEFAHFVARGLFDAATAAAVRAQGEEIIARVNTDASPFCDGWHDWRPDPAWGLPVLPEDWDLP